MKDLSTIPHNPHIEKITELLCNKTQNQDKQFFRTEAAYFIAKVAGCMRASIVSKARGKLPINLYTILLASSGYGKGYSVSVMENQLLSGFKTALLRTTFPQVAEVSLYDRATEIAVAKNSSQNTEFETLKKEWQSYGNYPFTFDSGTTPAIKQLRQKLLLSNIGSINYQLDEIGSNLLSNIEILGLFLELYDLGMVKQKLVKNTADNARGEDLDGSTPTNMLLFGTPSKLLDGTSVEDLFYSLLETGYARRTLFALGKKHKSDANKNLTAAEVFHNLINPTNDQAVTVYHDLFESLANPAYANTEIYIPDSVDILDIEYKLQCERLAEQYQDDTDTIKKSELEHRYFKTLKLAGALAFLDIESLPVDQDGHLLMTEDHFYQAMKIVEESGLAFEQILHRDMPHIRLAKFIANQEGKEVTFADLTEKLPYFGKSKSEQTQMMNLAKGYGLKNNILITSRMNDDIELFKAKTLPVTNLDKLILTMSQEKYGANGYFNQYKSWDYVCNTLPALTLNTSQVDGKVVHWINHHVKQQHRSEDDMLEPFNMVVLDIDTGKNLALTKELLKDYTYCIYTTKRNGENGEDRFRVIIPMNYTLELDRDDYKEFMNNVLAWFPIPVDEGCNQRSRKWLTNPNTTIYTNQGELLDILPFIPRSKSNESYQNQLHGIKNMTNLEKWFVVRISKGNRNDNLLRYAMALKDSGMTLADVEKSVKSFNAKLKNPLLEAELDNTILRTLAKSYV